VFAVEDVAMRSLITLWACLFLVAPSMAEEEHVYVGHGISMYGDLKYPADFPHFDYVNPDAPKGGDVKLWSFGGFDSLNPFTLKGTAAAGIGQIYDTLLASSADEAFSEYGRLAELVKMPEDRSWVAFKIRNEARWHDGEPVTAEDVVWTFETLTTVGHPYFAAYYANVVSATDEGDGWVRFDFDAPGNRELPLIMGQMQILPKHWYADKDFAETTLEIPLGSGPYRIVNVDPGRSVTYERVEDYWGEDLPVNVGMNNFGTIRYDEYLDFDIALEAFKAHEYDFRVENNSKLWATAYTGPNFDKGLIITEEVPHERPTGMQAFAFNLRKPIFQDPRVREALGYAFDFEWANTNLFYGQYDRTTSYFSNSDLAATGAPGEAELALLEPFRDQLPEEVFGEIYTPPVTDGSGNIRAGLREAKALLEEAGWTVQNGVLTGPNGEVMRFEILLLQPAFERIVQPLARNLERLGAEVNIRIVDASQYERRMETFDFDMTVESWGQSRSPGNEQRDFWTSAAADIEGSRNTLGLKNPVVDALVEEIIFADNREELVTAAKALDRVLQWGHYVIPNWHIRYDRVAYWDKFGQPDVIPPDGVQFNAWWVDEEEAKELEILEESLDGDG
jgi:microcin C transport system substrate-binding protein